MMAEEKPVARPEEKSKLTRIPFVLTPKSLVIFNRIKADCYAASNPEVMLKAIKLLKKCLDADKRGAKIAITERDGKIAEISMFLL